MGSHETCTGVGDGDQRRFDVDGTLALLTTATDGFLILEEGGCAGKDKGYRLGVSSLLARGGSVRDEGSDDGVLPGADGLFGVGLGETDSPRLVLKKSVLPPHYVSWQLRGTGAKGSDPEDLESAKRYMPQLDTR
jgi:hypothetical protein